MTGRSDRCIKVGLGAVPGGGGGLLPQRGGHQARGLLPQSRRAFPASSAPRGLTATLCKAVWNRVLEIEAVPGLVLSWVPLRRRSCAHAAAAYGRPAVERVRCGGAAGEAKLVVQGALLGERQNASVVVTEFPMAMLQPMFRAVPALQHAAPAVPTAAPSAPAGPAAAFLNNLTLPFLKSVLLLDGAPRHAAPPVPCRSPRIAPGPGAGCMAQACGVEGQRGRGKGRGVQHEQLRQQPSEWPAVRARHPG